MPQYVLYITRQFIGEYRIKLEATSDEEACEIAYQIHATDKKIHEEGLTHPRTESIKKNFVRKEIGPSCRWTSNGKYLNI